MRGHHGLACGRRVTARRTDRRVGGAVRGHAWLAEEALLELAERIEERIERRVAMTAVSRLRIAWSLPANLAAAARGRKRSPGR